jgi:hypothetical protein
LSEENLRAFMRQMIVEDLAEVLYRHDAGMTDAEYERENSEPRKSWACTSESFDENLGELTEWQRDEYRLQASAVVDKFLAALDRVNWRPASEPPPSDAPVLVRNQDGSCEVETYDARLGWGSPFEGFRDQSDGPVHWMPIPPPPADRKENKRND